MENLLLSVSLAVSSISLLLYIFLSLRFHNLRKRYENSLKDIELVVLYSIKYARNEKDLDRKIAAAEYRYIRRNGDDFISMLRLSVIEQNARMEQEQIRKSDQEENPNHSSINANH